MALLKVRRYIYYYELSIDFDPSFTCSDKRFCREFFHQIKAIIDAKDTRRYVENKDKLLFINDFVFKPTEKAIYGKLRSIRKDVFPELINTTTDATRDIEADEEDGIVETTHFVIDYSQKKLFAAIEYNQDGAKFYDLQYYLSQISEGKNWIERVEIYPVIQDVLKTIKNRVKNYSEMIVKVSKTNVGALSKIESGLASSLDNLENYYEQEYAELRLKFDYTNLATAIKTKSRISSLIDKLTGNKKNLDLFDTLKVKAEDSERNNRLQVFDLLIDKLKSEVKVEKREKSRTLNSLDMFEIMTSEIARLKHILK